MSPESVAAQPLRLVRGGLYRNPLGAELTAIEPVYLSAVLHKYTTVFASAFGDIWVFESRDKSFGPSLHLVTAEGLESCGYRLLEEPEAQS